MDISYGISQPLAAVMPAALVGKILKTMMTNPKDASASLKILFFQLADTMMLILKIHLSLILNHFYLFMTKVLPGSKNMKSLCSTAEYNQPMTPPM